MCTRTVIMTVVLPGEVHATSQDGGLHDLPVRSVPWSHRAKHHFDARFTAKSGRTYSPHPGGQPTVRIEGVGAAASPSYHWPCGSGSPACRMTGPLQHLSPGCFP
ncbi:hypothetical protein C2E23DRAFT_822910 [Lenzites betulinus]|nr:hypothetical protein C2E23DRAFT_822910 [Lenzites betulinus]